MSLEIVEERRIRIHKVILQNICRKFIATTTLNGKSCNANVVKSLMLHLCCTIFAVSTSTNHIKAVITQTHNYEHCM